MKCIYCSEDSDYSERKAKGGCCKKCGHHFAFEPQKETPGVTDRLFLHAYASVSGGATIACTERQLWYELNRMMRWKWTDYIGLVLGVVIVGYWLLGILFGVGRIYWTQFGDLVVVFILFALLVYLVNALRRQTKHIPRVTYEEFQSGDYVGNRANIHQPLDKVLPPPTLQPPLAAREVEPELFNYSFDRVLVTDRAETAAMLVANNFHFEYNCAILSADGYPAGTAATVMMMLRGNPRLQVFALHDATVEGCRLPLLLRTEPWFPEPTVTVLDLGLCPRHVIAQRMIKLHGPSTVVPDELATLLSPSEIRWLARGNRAELAAFRPQRLMHIVAYRIGQAAQLRKDAWAMGKQEPESQEETESQREADSEADGAPGGWSLAGALTSLAVILHLRDDPGPLKKRTDSEWPPERKLPDHPDTFG